MSSSPSTPASNAADQARIRKERREAKIRAGGSARLDKISGLGGGFKREPPPEPASTPPTTGHHVPDPDEVDISEHFYTPASNAASRPSAQNAFSNPNPSAPQLSDDQLRAMMLGFPGTPNAGGGALPQNANPFASSPFMGPSPGDAPSPDDPMLKLLQQMMGGASPPGGGGNGTNMVSPNFAGGMPGMNNAQPEGPINSYAYIWRVVHAIFALSLGLYIAFATTFSGTKLERERSALSSSSSSSPLHSGEGDALDVGSVRFFYIFATFEVLLQTSRFFLEKGTVQPSGILGMLMGFLPPPWKAYVALVLRYGSIWTTVSGDAMVCVFVLGVCSWLRAS